MCDIVPGVNTPPMAKMTNDAQTRTWELWTSYALLGHRRLKASAAGTSSVTADYSQETRFRPLTGRIVKTGSWKCWLGFRRVSHNASNRWLPEVLAQTPACCADQRVEAGAGTPAGFSSPAPVIVRSYVKGIPRTPSIVEQPFNPGHNSSNSASDNSNIRAAQNTRRGPAVRL